MVLVHVCFFFRSVQQGTLSQLSAPSYSSAVQFQSTSFHLTFLNYHELHQPSSLLRNLLSSHKNRTFGIWFISFLRW